MFWTINERFGVERQVERAICHEIARGAWPPGGAIPSPQVLAEEGILNPRTVESACARLAKAGLLIILPNGGYGVVADARSLARDLLLGWAREEVKDLASVLRRAGLSEEDVRCLFKEAGNV